jgi:MraZ protein
MSDVYTGSHEHAFDAKGRITVPSDWRAEEYETSLHAFEAAGCLKVYPASALARLQEQIRGLEGDDPKRVRVERLASLAQAVKWDEQGRIMIKERLRMHAGLKKEAVLAGKLSHFEIWERSRYAAQEGTRVLFEEATRGLGI